MRKRIKIFLEKLKFVENYQRFLSKMAGFSVLFSVFCATGGQHEARLVLCSPVKDEVYTNSTEPQAAH